MQPSQDRVNFSVADRDLKYYIFDWDDNILHMPTHIHLERKTDDGRWVPHPVSTAVFSVIRNDTENFRPPGGDWENAFLEFRDFDDEDQNIFLRDTRAAIDRVMRGASKPAPSFSRFKQALIEGRLFAIVTARGHDPHIIRAGVAYFIDTVLTSDEREQMRRNLRGYLYNFAPEAGVETDDAVLAFYLDLNKYHGVMSPHFKKLIMGRRGAAVVRTEEGKQFAIHDFVEHVLEISRERGLTRPISIGFSDDDVGNARAVEDYIRRELAPLYPSVKFVVYYTADPAVAAGRKVVVQGQLTLDLAEG